MEAERTDLVLDASAWQGQLESFLTSAFGLVPSPDQQLDLANQLRAVLAEIAAAPLSEAQSDVGWVAIQNPPSIVLLSGEVQIVSLIGMDGMPASIEVGNGDMGAWSIHWDTPLEGVSPDQLLENFAGTGSIVPDQPMPAVRIAVFQHEQLLSSTAFQHGGGWEDDLDDQPLIDKGRQQLEEAFSTFELPDELEGQSGEIPAVGIPAPSAGDAGPSVPAGGGLDEIGGMAFKGAAAMATMAAGALAREVMKAKSRKEAPAAPTPDARPQPDSTDPSAAEAKAQPAAPGARPKAPAPQPTAERRTCPSCSKPLSKRARFCPHCGATTPEPEKPAEPPAAERPKFCPNCGTPTEAGGRFCGSCGQNL